MMHNQLRHYLVWKSFFLYLTLILFSFIKLHVKVLFTRAMCLHLVKVECHQFQFVFSSWSHICKMEVNDLTPDPG